MVFLSARGIHTYFLFSLSGNEISTERRRGEEREMRLISFGDYNNYIYIRGDILVL